MKTLLSLLAAVWHWLDTDTEESGARPEPMEIGIGIGGETYLFRIYDKESRRLLEAAAMKYALHPFLNFQREDVDLVMEKAARAWVLQDHLANTVCAGK